MKSVSSKLGLTVRLSLGESNTLKMLAIFLMINFLNSKSVQWILSQTLPILELPEKMVKENNFVGPLSTDSLFVGQILFYRKSRLLILCDVHKIFYR